MGSLYSLSFFCCLLHSPYPPLSSSVNLLSLLTAFTLHAACVPQCVCMRCVQSVHDCNSVRIAVLILYNAPLFIHRVLVCVGLVSDERIHSSFFVLYSIQYTETAQHIHNNNNQFLAIVVVVVRRLTLLTLLLLLVKKSNHRAVLIFFFILVRLNSHFWLVTVPQFHSFSSPFGRRKEASVLANQSVAGSTVYQILSSNRIANQLYM